MTMLTSPVIETRKACVTFEGDCVVDEVDLKIAAGEFVAILGGNGAGKTTLVRAILGLVPLSHGWASVNGDVAYVPQRLAGTSSVPVSVLETVRAARLKPYRIGWLKKADKAAVQEALTSVGLWDRRHDRLDQLSGGQQRRVMIARSLASGAAIHFMDEPTAGVDAENQKRLAEVLAHLKAEGKTIVVVAHELGAMSELVDRVVVMTHPEHGDEPHAQSHGSIAYDGPPPGPAHLTGDAFHHHHDDLGITHSHGPLKDPV